MFFDVSGLVQWYAYAEHATGIQRVMQGILGTSALAHHPNVQFIARAVGSDRFYKVDPTIICGLNDSADRRLAVAKLRKLFTASKRLASPFRLLREIHPGHVSYVAMSWARLDSCWPAVQHGDETALLGLLEAAEMPSHGDLLVSLGDFWCHRGHVDALLRLKKQSGSTLIVMIHDLAAISHPEWAHPYYGREFASQFNKIAPEVDHWLTNSHYVKSQLEQFLLSADLPVRPTDVLPMGWPQAASRPNCVFHGDSQVLQKYDLKTDHYFLHVGTLQPRKNIDGLVDATSHLRSVVGEQMPTCILVGRDGWRAEALRSRIKHMGWNGGVRWLSEVDDAELSVLYRHAKFTVAASHDEGWGLAAQESLAHGTPCIASTAGGLPEAGRDLALYVDAGESGALVDAIKSYATNGQIISAARKLIRSRMRDAHSLPTWADAACHIMTLGQERTSASANPIQLKAMSAAKPAKAAISP